MKKIKKYIIFSLIIGLGTLILFHGSTGSQEVNIVGSTSIQPVCEDLVEEYRKDHPDVKINVQGGGSNMAIKCVAADISDIGMCSKELADVNNFTIYKLGDEGIVVAVNPSNNVSNLSSDTIRKIFQGEITNWAQLGGENHTINIFIREEGSGTLDAFKEIIMNNTPISDNAVVFNSQGSLKQAIEQDKYAIGIVSFSYLDWDIKALAVDGIYPSVDSIKDGSYPLKRPFLLLIGNNSSNETQNFLNWLDSDEAKKILEENKII